MKVGGFNLDTLQPSEPGRAHWHAVLQRLLQGGVQRDTLQQLCTGYQVQAPDPQRE